jgi:hypothetical protein
LAIDSVRVERLSKVSIDNIVNSQLCIEYEWLVFEYMGAHIYSIVYVYVSNEEGVGCRVFVLCSGSGSQKSVKVSIVNNRVSILFCVCSSIPIGFSR